MVSESRMAFFRDFVFRSVGRHKFLMIQGGGGHGPLCPHLDPPLFLFLVSIWVIPEKMKLKRLIPFSIGRFLLHFS